VAVAGFNNSVEKKCHNFEIKMHFLLKKFLIFTPCALTLQKNLTKLVTTLQ